jgi:hypothetical protein
VVLAACAMLSVWPDSGAWGQEPIAPAASATTVRARPLALDEHQPAYFRWQDRTFAVVTSGEHYGAVLNLDFDFTRYLDTLAADGMNGTRTFNGTYVEPPGAFGIERNTLAPAPGRFLAPWSRSDQPGYAGGGTKLDLSRFEPAYLERLEAFLRAAAERKIVVELTLFCATYGEEQWKLSPWNPANNVNGEALAGIDWRRLHQLEGNPALPFQEALVRYLVRELNEHENVYYEIQNEPWADDSTIGEVLNPHILDNHNWPNAVQIPSAASVAWQSRIARVIADEEKGLPNRHLIAQNISNFRLKLRESDVAPGVSVLNFHYAWPEAVAWSRLKDFRPEVPAQARLVGCNETGFLGTGDDVYRRQAWAFLFSGGGLFNHLDYSFSVGHEDGRDHQPASPGGGGPAIRKQLGALSRFLNGFRLTTMVPSPSTVLSAPGMRVYALAGHNEYAVYLEGRSGPIEMVLSTAPGFYRLQWIDPTDGHVLAEEPRRWVEAGPPLRLTTPPFEREIALGLQPVE